MNAQVIHPFVYQGTQHSPGETVDLDPRSFENLERKGWVAAAGEDDATEPRHPSKAPRKRVVAEPE